jgi:transposase
MTKYILGIDIAKATFDVALLTANELHRGHFANDPDGFAKLGRWLTHRHADQVHACMEATNRYWQALAERLYSLGHTVSVVNPKQVRKYAESQMQRNKTDPEDAKLIADYCLRQEPAPWAPAPAAYRELKAMVRHLVALKDDRQRIRNRRSPELPAAVLVHIDATLAFFKEQIDALQQQINAFIADHPPMQQDKELLLSIPGVGDGVANTFMAEIPDVSLFAQTSQIDAYVGLTPGRKESGTSRRSSGHLVKWGNRYLRRVLYMPALSAHRYNPIIAALRERLQARGKPKMTIIVAVMRKLLNLCYGVLKTRKPFDPNHAVNVSGT